MLGSLALLLFIFARPVAPAHAASFVVEDNAFRIYGEIEPGDDAKFLAAWGKGFDQVRVQSTGGDLNAALAIGEAIARRQPLVVVDGLCMSNCAAFIFLATPQHRVLRDGLVCFRGAPARNETELRAHIRAEEVRFGEMTLEQVDDAVKARWPAMKALQPRVDAILRAGGADQQILHETQLLIPYDFVDNPYQPRPEWLQGKQAYWCPLPEAFKRYKVDGFWDWYPATDRALYRLGQSLSENWIFSSRIAGKGDPER